MFGLEGSQELCITGDDSSFRCGILSRLQFGLIDPSINTKQDGLVRDWQVCGDYIISVPSNREFSAALC